MTLEETLKSIKPLDEEKMETARKRWDSIAKPLHSLGKMEDLITQVVGITGEIKVDISKKALVAMCADNGVVEEGVTQTGQEVTAIVADNFVKETTTACVMCHQCGVAVKPVDVGMVRDTTVRTDLKVMYGTRNMTKGPAMTREEAVKGIEAGIRLQISRIIQRLICHPTCKRAISDHGNYVIFFTKKVSCPHIAKACGNRI